jgi:leader peptidase (prepilin peptidase)/N-methyltransferase
LTALWLTWTGFAGILGLILGSFCGVCIDRLPSDRSLWPRSACDACGHPVRARDNVPLVSYALLGGRCRDCSAPIPRAYPLVELLVALIALALWHRIVPGPDSVDAVHLVAWATYLGFSCLLVVLSFVDLRHHIIPDETSIYAVPLGVLSAFVLERMHWHGFPIADWHQSVFGALLAGGFFGGVALLVGFVLGREALGWGDVKLVAMIGSFVGVFPGGLIALLTGSLLGTVVAFAHLAWTRRRSYLPMGPFLAAGALVWLLFGDHVFALLFPGIEITVDPR